MLIKISTRFSTTESKLWELIRKPASLEFVASPILKFVPMDEDDLATEWRVDQLYRMKLYLLNFVPIGQHQIRLVRIDRNSNTIQSRERGSLVTVWNHKIEFQEESPGIVKYTDEVEIRAGWLTPLIWVFPQLFYRHRQRRWRTLLRQA